MSQPKATPLVRKIEELPVELEASLARSLYLLSRIVTEGPCAGRMKNLLMQFERVKTHPDVGQQLQETVMGLEQQWQQIYAERLTNHAGQCNCAEKKVH
ncbi:hypothetical protein LH51_16865 [Nitrincola sp. A-D6]|uniref:hypothetical protein n=1 Tax=Nitrincola sp. A-D6 TaxID=1545442 RepID=UPI00051F9587|nr:hypothetical protein [Nitrincola sp. A-D6]KGK41161.1 hypothetical protein LH51_16865 [Nitrincola sp. A-D6]